AGHRRRLRTRRRRWARGGGAHPVGAVRVLADHHRVAARGRAHPVVPVRRRHRRRAVLPDPLAAAPAVHDRSRDRGRLRPARGALDRPRAGRLEGEGGGPHRHPANPHPRHAGLRRQPPATGELMPELPEVEALAHHLREHAIYRPVARVDVASMIAVKTYDPPLQALAGRVVTGASRYGKFLSVEFADRPDEPLHLITHLSRAGWLRWHDSAGAAPPKPGRGPLALRVHLDSVGGPGFD